MKPEDLGKLIEDKLESKINLILYNDDHNTFEHVINCLVSVLEHSPEQAEQCALIVHHKGRCAVKSGAYIEMAICKAILSSADLTVKLE